MRILKNSDHMPTFIQQQANLALTYAEDGAYESAARVLEQLAEQTRKHADAVRATFEAAMRKD